MTTHPEQTYPPLLAQGQTWEEMTVGSVFRTAARTITETDLITFVTWGGFTEPLFLDASHAAAGGYTGRWFPAPWSTASARAWSFRPTCSTGPAWPSCPWT